MEEEGLAVATTNKDAQSEAPVQTADPEAFVYCKGCGQPLESRARLQKPRPVVDTMMCASCQEIHGHRLVPTSGAPTFCYRCGTREEVFVAPGTSPATYYVCPRCLPDRAERYAAGDFETPEKPAATQAETESTSGSSSAAGARNLSTRA